MNETFIALTTTHSTIESAFAADKSEVTRRDGADKASKRLRESTSSSGRDANYLQKLISQIPIRGYDGISQSMCA
jgi:hypothetical protein